MSGAGQTNFWRAATSQQIGFLFCLVQVPRGVGRPPPRTPSPQPKKQNPFGGFQFVWGIWGGRPPSPGLYAYVRFVLLVILGVGRSLLNGAKDNTPSRTPGLSTLLSHIWGPEMRGDLLKDSPCKVNERSYSPNGAT